MIYRQALFAEMACLHETFNGDLKEPSHEENLSPYALLGKMDHVDIGHIVPFYYP